MASAATTFLGKSYVLTDDVQKWQTMDPSKFRSAPRMTKYEFNQVVSLRTTQLAQGAIPFVALPEGFQIQTNMQLRDVALLELQVGKIPFLVKREMPNHKTEYWRVSELDIDTVRHFMRGFF